MLFHAPAAYHGPEDGAESFDQLTEHGASLEPACPIAGAPAPPTVASACATKAAFNEHTIYIGCYKYYTCFMLNLQLPCVQGTSQFPGVFQVAGLGVGLEVMHYRHHGLYQSGGRWMSSPAPGAAALLQLCRAFHREKVLLNPFNLIHTSSADHLVEAGSVGDGSTGSRVPEPVETCGFCFPGQGSAVQETKSCHSTSCPTGERAAPSHSGICSTGSAGAIPSPDDGHFKIICSPSQEKTPMV